MHLMRVLPYLKRGLVNPDHLFPVIYCPVLVQSGKGQSGGDMFRVEKGFLGGNTLLKPQVAYLFRDRASAGLICHAIGDLGDFGERSTSTSQKLALQSSSVALVQ